MKSLRFLVFMLQLAFGLALVAGAGWAFWFVVAAPLLAVFVP